MINEEEADQHVADEVSEEVDSKDKVMRNEKRRSVIFE